MTIASVTSGVACLALLTAASGHLCGCDTNTPSSPTVQPTAEALPPVRTLENGLVIEDLRVGGGEACTTEDRITMNFTAKLADGTVYDSSEKRKRSWTIDLDDPGLIEGLRQGIPGMRVGGARTLSIPWTIGYGAQGRMPIPPKTDLIFEIELLSIDP